MNTKPKISVIVPVYGVEKYIERCARSLFEQTFDDIEYIFVDDCTLDKSIEILQKVLLEYPLRIEQTRIVKMQSNTGLAGVRSYGIKLAKGNYIIHCDSDDWLDKDMCRVLYEKAVEENADVVICDYITTNGINNKKYSGLSSTNKEQVILDMLFQRNSWSLWNKLFKKDIYKQEITYAQDNMGEDMTLVMQMIYYCNRISYVSNVYYYYYQNSLSITQNVSPTSVFNRFKQGCNNAKIVEAFYKNIPFNNKINEGLIYMKYKRRNLLLPLLKDKKYFKIWIKTFPEINVKFFLCYNIPIKDKIRFFLSLLRLYPRFFVDCKY